MAFTGHSDSNDRIDADSATFPQNTGTSDKAATATITASLAWVNHQADNRYLAFIHNSSANVAITGEIQNKWKDVDGNTRYTTMKKYTGLATETGTIMQIDNLFLGSEEVIRHKISIDASLAAAQGFLAQVDLRKF